MISVIYIPLPRGV